MTGHKSQKAQPAVSVSDLVERIQRDSDAGRVAAGTLLGTEQELCERYGASPTTYRQAARILEATGFAVARRGNRGGLVTQGMRPEGAAKIIATYFQFVGAPPSAASAVSNYLLQLVARLAAERMTLGEADVIRAKIRASDEAAEKFERGILNTDLLYRLALAAHNPFLTLLYRAILDYVADVVPFELTPVSRPRTYGPQRIAEAAIGGDGHLAAEIARETRKHHDELFRNLPGGDDTIAEGLGIAQSSSERTRSATLARRMLGEIRRKDWPVGFRLGDEPELMRRYGVSRATFRQAVRLLEQYSAVRTRRGPGGGLVVTAPSPNGVMEVGLATLQRLGTSSADIQDVMPSLVLLLFQRIREPAKDSDFDFAALFKRATASAVTSPVEAATALWTDLLRVADNTFLNFAFNLATAFEATIEDRPAPTPSKVRDLLTAVSDCHQDRDSARAARALIELAQIIRPLPPH